MSIFTTLVFVRVIVIVECSTIKAFKKGLIEIEIKLVNKKVLMFSEMGSLNFFYIVIIKSIP